MSENINQGFIVVALWSAVSSCQSKSSSGVPGVRCERTSMNWTPMGAMRPVAVPSSLTRKRTNGPEVRSARTGVTITPPAFVCCTHG